MQLKKHPHSIRAALAAATCTVLAQPAMAASQAEEGQWDVKSGLLFYDEGDRIMVAEPVAEASTTLEDGSLLTLRGIIDTVTGASPNGASPTNTAQTFTSPSGNETYVVAAGDTPMRDVKDLRVAFSGEWEKELNRMVRNTLGAGISHEVDYLSLSLSDTLRRDFNNRQTTLAAGIGLSLDGINPSGGTPTEMSLLSAPVIGEGGDETKNSIDLLLGVTQILSAHTLTQLNYTMTHSSGYHTDPYKIISLVDGSSGSTLDYLYEKRPESRTSHVLNWRLNHQFKEDVLYLGYRYFTDDWGISAHTLDLKYRYEMGGGSYLQPHLRLYQQSAADFYHHSLVAGAPLPEYASADLRLGEMDSTTIGLKFGMPVEGGEFTVRLEHMMQEGESHPADAIGIQQNYDLYPTLDANIIQFGYSFKL